MIQTHNIHISHDWINKLFSEDDKVPRTLFVARKVAGSATYKQRETIWNYIVLQGQFVYQSRKQREFVYYVYYIVLRHLNKNSKELFLFWLKCFFPNYTVQL